MNIGDSVDMARLLARRLYFFRPKYWKLLTSIKNVLHLRKENINNNASIIEHISSSILRLFNRLIKFNMLFEIIKECISEYHYIQNQKHFHSAFIAKYQKNSKCKGENTCIIHRLNVVFHLIRVYTDISFHQRFLELTNLQESSIREA